MKKSVLLSIVLIFLGFYFSTIPAYSEQMENPVSKPSETRVPATKNSSEQSEASSLEKETSSTKTSSTSVSSDLATVVSEAAPKTVMLEKTLDVNVTTTKEQLIKKVTNTLKKQAGLTDVKLTDSFQLKPGEQTVTGTAKQNGQFVNFDLPIRAQTLTIELKAELPPIHLGDKQADIDPSTFIKYLCLDDQMILPQDFEQSGFEAVVCTSDDAILSDWVTYPTELTIEVRSKTDQDLCAQATFPVEVNWGDSIVFGSYDTDGDRFDRVGGSFSLHHDASNSDFLTFAPAIDNEKAGTNGDDEIMIHAVFPNERYYGVFHYPWAKLGDSFFLDEEKKDDDNQILTVKGDELKKAVTAKWHQKYDDGHYPLAPGDLLQAWQKEPDKNWHLQDDSGFSKEQWPILTKTSHSVFYEVTKNHQLRLLQVNLLKTSPQMLVTDSEQTVTAEQVKTLFPEIDQYPDIYIPKQTIDRLNQLDLTQGVETLPITVAQRMESAGKATSVYFDYHLPVIKRDKTPPSASAVPTIFAKGEALPSQTSEIKKLLKDLADNDTKNIEKISVAYAKNYQGITSETGRKEIILRLTDVSGNSSEVKIPIFVIDSSWGNEDCFLLSANDLTLKKEDLAGLSQSQIKEQILQKSGAKAWDVTHDQELTNQIQIKNSEIDLTRPKQQVVLCLPETNLTYEITLTLTNDSELLDMKIPTKMLFGATDISGTDTNDVFSPKYAIVNQTKGKTVRVNLKQVGIMQNDDAIQLTDQTSSLAENQLALQLKATRNGGAKTIAITEQITSQTLFNLDNHTSYTDKAELSFNGIFKGSLNKRKTLALKMTLEFKVLGDSTKKGTSLPK